MPIISIKEILHLILMTAALGYIFSGFIRPALSHIQLHLPKFNWKEFKFAILISAPAVVLHELAHKLIAMLFGLTAEFQASFFGLGIGVFLRIINSPFIIFAPGYVSISSTADPLTLAVIAFAGPFTNLVLWLGSSLILSRARHLTRKQALILYLTKRINMILFIFNMLPIPPFDGSKVFLGLINAIF